MKKSQPYALQLLIVVALAIGFACQKAQLAEYKKLDSDADVPRMAIEDAKKDFDLGNTVIVDSRPESAYKHEHIAGSINIVVGSPDDAFASLPKNKKIVVYCS